MRELPAGGHVAHRVHARVRRPQPIVDLDALLGPGDAGALQIESFDVGEAPGGQEDDVAGNRPGGTAASGSSFGSTRGSRATMLTSLPSRRNVWASSHPMGPAPTTSSRRGRSVSAN